MLKFIKSNHLLFTIGLLAIILYYVPILIIGEDWYVIIHDNLDSSIANIKMLKDRNLVFDYSSNEPIIGPVTRSAFRAPWDITILLYTFLPLFWGVIVNNFLARVIAYIGMYLLLSSYVLKNNDHKSIIAMLSALCFAFISFYSDYGISSTGIPLILYAFLNLKNKKKIGVSFFCIFIFGIYSDLVLSGIFIGICGIIYYLYIVINEKKYHWVFLMGLVFLGILYLLTNIHLVLDFFHGQISLSNRIEFYDDSSLKQILLNHLRLFCLTQIHTGELITIPVIVLFIYCCIVNKNIDRFATHILMAIIAIISFSLVYHVLLSFLKPGSFFHQFQFDRFYFFLTSLWIILLARVAEVIIGNTRGLWVVICTCLIIIGCDFIRNKEYMFQVKKYVFHIQTEPTYRQCYDEKLFTIINDYIGKPKSEYSVASLGIYPAVAQYNGFCCIDGYWNSYPLDYKHEFRKIIADELDKSDEIKNYFDHWGSRCYIFSSELGKEYRYGKNCGIVVHQLDINTKQLQKMGCQYVFSAVPIENYENLGWKFEKSFSTDNSFWEIYLYSL